MKRASLFLCSVLFLASVILVSPVVRADSSATPSASFWSSVVSKVTGVLGKLSHLGRPAANAAAVATSVFPASTVCSNRVEELKSADGWLLLGPNDGKVNTFEASADKSIYYVSTSSGGVFRSLDHGVSWQSFGVGLGSSKINFLKFINGDLYAADDFAGIYVLKGNVWQDFFNRNGNVFLKIDYDNVHNTFWALSDIGLYFSHDKGASWQKSNVDVGSFPDVLVSKSGYILLSNFSSVYQSNDEGSTWRTVFTTGAPAGDSLTRTPLVEDKNGNIYVAGLDYKLYRRSTGANGFENTGINSATGAFIVTDSYIISLTKADELGFFDFTGKNLATVKSSSYSSGNGFWDVRRFFAISPNNIIMAHDNGISILDISAKTVKHLGSINGYSEITSLTGSNNMSSLMTTYWDHTSQISNNCGVSWSVFPVAGEGGVIFANPKGNGYLSGDGFSNLDTLSYFIGSSLLKQITVGGNNPSFNKNTITYDINTSTTQTYIIGSNSDGQYLVSFNMVESPQGLINVSQIKLPVSSATGLAADPKISGRLVLSGDNYVYESNDMGVTWTKILDYRQGGLGTPIAINPTDSKEILLGNALLKEGVVTKLSLPAGVPYAVFDDIFPGVLYAASPGIPSSYGQMYPASSGFFASIDSGKSWTSFNSGLYSKDVRYILPVKDKVFVSTFGSGNAVILKSKLGVFSSNSTTPIASVYLGGSASPTVPYGSSFNFLVVPTNAGNCSVSGPGSWLVQNPDSVGGGGTWNTGNLTSTSTFKVTCSAIGGAIPAQPSAVKIVTILPGTFSTSTTATTTAKASATARKSGLSLTVGTGETETCPDPTIDPNSITVKVASTTVNFMKTRGVMTPLPLTPIYDLVVNVVPVFSNCANLPGILPFEGDLIADGRDIIGPGVFLKTEKTDQNGNVIYEWKINGWPNGIVADEKLEQLIAAVGTGKTVKVVVKRIGSATTAGTHEKNISFNLCAPLYGDGPRAIVSMRSQSSQIQASQMAPIGDFIREEGFETTQPFKKYSIPSESPTGKSYFEHFADLGLYDDTGWAMIFGKFFIAANSRPRQISSCGDGASQYFFLTKRITPTSDGRLLNYAPYGGGIAFLNANGPIPVSVPMHEMGHSFAWLQDEYPTGIDVTRYSANCIYSSDQEEPYWGSPARLKGLGGNGFYFGDKIPGCTLQRAYRPSVESIMHSSDSSKEFNVVSCGYIIHAIKNGTTATVDGRELVANWQECMKMDRVVKPIISFREQISLFGQSFRSMLAAVLPSLAQTNSTPDSAITFSVDPTMTQVESFAPDGTITSEFFKSTGNTNDPSSWHQVTPENQPISTTPAATPPLTVSTGESTSCPNPKTIIAVGGKGSTLEHPFFSFMEQFTSLSYKVALSGRSVEENTAVIRNAIQTELTNGQKVLVVAHSLGSILVFNIREEFVGKPVEFIYIDPPYNTGGWLTRNAPSLFTEPTAINQAREDGIATDPNTIIWTNGESAAPKHDPWSSLADANNTTTLASDVRATLLQEEGNLTDTINVAKCSSPSTNLTLSSFTASGNSAVLSNQFYTGPLTLSAVITNTGTGASPASSVTFKWEELTADDVVLHTLGSGVVFPLSTSGRTTASLNGNLLQPKTYSLSACIDPDNLVKESNEEDNCATLSVKAVAPGSIGSDGKPLPVRKSVPAQTPASTISPASPTAPEIPVLFAPGTTQITFASSGVSRVKIEVCSSTTCYTLAPALSVSGDSTTWQWVFTGTEPYVGTTGNERPLYLKISDLNSSAVNVSPLPILVMRVQ